MDLGRKVPIEDPTSSAAATRIARYGRVVAPAPPILLRSLQSLRRLVCLCTDCHRTTHYGLAELQGNADDALRHLMAVNRLRFPQAKSHISEAIDLWRARSLRTWTLDLQILIGQEVEIIAPD